MKINAFIWLVFISTLSASLSDRPYENALPHDLLLHEIGVHIKQAAARGMLAVLKDLLRYASPAEAQNAIYEACINNQMESVKVLLEDGRATADQKSFLLASHLSDGRIFDLLEEYYPLNRSEASGLLYVACKAGDKPAIKTLISSKVTRDQVDDILSILVDGNHVEAVDALFMRRTSACARSAEVIFL